MILLSVDRQWLPAALDVSGGIEQEYTDDGQHP
jgi:hypothetical protein